MFKDFLLTEGILERETTFISRAIINAIKNNIDKIKKERGLLFKNGTTPYIGVTPIDLKLSSKYPNIIGTLMNDYIVHNSGSYNSENNLIKLRLYAPLNELPGIINKIIPSIKNTLRHELEHSVQLSDKLMHGANTYTNFSKDDLQSIIDYYISPAEIEAYVVGLYKQAKTSKKPFSEIIKNKLSTLEDIIRTNGFSQEEALKTIYKIGKKWWGYAKRRFPKLQ